MTSQLAKAFHLAFGDVRKKKKRKKKEQKKISRNSRDGREKIRTAILNIPGPSCFLIKFSSANDSVP